MKIISFDYTSYKDQLIPLLLELEKLEEISGVKLSKLTKKFPKKEGGTFSKTQILAGYIGLAGTNGLKSFNQELVKKIQMKPTRTISGVAPITVLTKPFPCPGKCIFCPSDVRMPKSYLSDEPGAQRAERNYFDPYLQTYTRLDALNAMGHHVDKAELIILGGTWSFYPEKYQIWFVKECFRALNEFGIKDERKKIRQIYDERLRKLEENDGLALSDNPEINKKRMEANQLKGDQLKKKYNQVVSELYVAPELKLGLDEYQSASWDELEAEHRKNALGIIRNVGLVIETRPDNISPEEVKRIRRLGCTKTQIGVQSLQDDVLQKNNRGHDVEATRKAFKLLRQAGFKIHAHWMANLYGSNPELDKKDFEVLFNDPDFKPDELKLYPCSLIESAELFAYYNQGLWHPYTDQELLDVLSYCIMNTPPYCRLTRIIRDIPSQDIVVGNKKTNFRQIAELSLEKIGQESQDIRAREIRRENFDVDQARLEIIEYETSIGKELFLQMVAPVSDEKNTGKKSEKLLAFLRLSLPKDFNENNFISELQNSAMIREVHVYGRATKIGSKGEGQAQHSGFGSQLIEKAKEIARESGFKKLAVISAIGTREYYEKRGFEMIDMYQVAEI